MSPRLARISQLIAILGLSQCHRICEGFKLISHPPKCISRHEGGRLNARTQPHFCTFSHTVLKTAASRNDPPIKTLGLKLQNNSMTTSVRSRNSILSASVCISRLQKTLSLATSIFAPLRHLKPICGALLQPHRHICCVQEQAEVKNIGNIAA